MSDRPDIDRGDLRDKVAAPDPARASFEADSEAAGFPDGAAVRAADAEQARKAQRAVPRLDPDRAVSTADDDLDLPRRRHVHAVVIATIFILLAIIAAVTATLTYR